jgi:hypothetical protein
MVGTACGLSPPYRLLSKPLLGRLALNKVKTNADGVIYSQAYRNVRAVDFKCHTSIRSKNDDYCGMGKNFA